MIERSGRAGRNSDLSFPQNWNPARSLRAGHEAEDTVSMKPLRDILKHSSIYAIGQILTRVASVILLPLYTNCLTTADYGITAILDLVSTVLALMIGAGMVSAVSRFHFDQESETAHDELWWTGLTYLVAASAAVVVPLWFGRHVLASIALGDGVVNGSLYFSYSLATVFVQIAGQLIDGYLRVRRWSGRFVLVSLGRLLINVTLNVWLLVGLELGIEGLLLGNLLTSVLHTAVLLVMFQRSRGPYRFNLSLAGKMLKFSAPLVVTAVLAMLMHEADRYYLRIMVSLDEVGVYSLAHKVAFAVNTLCLLPFSSIWAVAMYDIGRMSDADRVFGRVFGWFVSGMGILLLGAALVSHPILPLLTPEAYGPAVDLIAVILLGFFVFGLQLQFEVPAMLARRTGLLVPGSIAGVLVSVAGNMLLIPHLGLWGAAWSGVLTYAAFSFTTLAVCRPLRAIAYPWRTSALTVAGLSASYCGVRWLLFPRLSLLGQLTASVCCCVIWAVVLFGRTAIEWWATRRPACSRSQDLTDVPESPVDDRQLVTT